jgi:hypothetical protein
VKIISSIQQRQTLEAVLKDVSKQSRVVQMNFIAIACDNLYISSPAPNNPWTRVENPYRIGNQVDAARIDAAIDAVLKLDGLRIIWPGDNVRINFEAMHKTGALL